MGCCKVREVGARQKWPLDEKDGIVGLAGGWEGKEEEEEKEGAKADEDSEGAKFSQDTNDITEPDPPPFPEPQAIPIVPPTTIISSLPITALSGLIREQSYPDKEYSSLENYILTLENCEKWKTIDQPQTGVVGKKLLRSKFTNEVPAFHLTIDFPKAVPAEFILGMLEEPDWRSDWDPRVEQMNRIYIPAEDCFLHYVLLRCNAPLKNREILVKQRVRREGPEVRVTFQSTAHKVSDR